MSLLIDNITVEGTLSATTISATTLSATTFFSGNTNLYSVFSPINSGVSTIGQGSNIITGGTTSNPTISITSSPSINGLTTSGATLHNGTLTVTGNTSVQGLTATTLSATTLSASTLFGTTLSASTIISGSTNLYNIFQTQGTSVLNVNAGSNITTGGTAQSPTINLTASPSINGLTTSGATLHNGTLTVTGNTSAQGLTATTLSATTLSYTNALPHGEMYMVGNATATVIGAISTYYLVSGTTTAGSLTKFSNPQNNRLTYTGGTTITFDVSCNLAMSSPNNNMTVRSVIVKNGTGTTVSSILSNTEQQMVLQPANTVNQTYCGGIVTLSTNDYVELYVRNTSGVHNLLVDSMQFVIKQI